MSCRAEYGLWPMGTQPTAVPFIVGFRLVFNEQDHEYEIENVSCIL